jgi:hypothetical protein
MQAVEIMMPIFYRFGERGLYYLRERAPMAKNWS